MSKIVNGYVYLDSGEKISLNEYEKRQRKIEKLNKMKEIEDYNNELELIVNSFTCEYHECGSHQMQLKINIDKDELIDFLAQLKDVNHSLDKEGE